MVNLYRQKPHLVYINILKKERLTILTKKKTTARKTTARKAATKTAARRPATKSTALKSRAKPKTTARPVAKNSVQSITITFNNAQPIKKTVAKKRTVNSKKKVRR